ncbi:OmpA family protein [Penaeicola halotolerans]|uniref:OmpA family protein n=1 Tax=Penaeicola halotolerans TaxID=2793196 RepID=UPI001CF8D388|nr:OmpA family protein [Penaeicola halotolerans]
MLKNIQTKSILFSLVAIIMMSSCVSQKKYDDLMANKVRLEGEKSALEESLKIASERADRLDRQVKQLITDNTNLEEKLYSANQELEKLKADYKNLQELYDGVLSNSSKLGKDLAEQQARLQAIENDLEATRIRNEELSKNLLAREKRVQELEKILADQENAVKALRDKIKQALLGFQDSDLSVEIRNGKVYVSLAEQLLFSSGSIVVDPKGANALKQLAQAIKDNPDISIMVEGHTDNVPIRGNNQYLKDNWDLSVLRATSITRILTANGVSQNQVLATGRGEYSPVTVNTTPEGRAKNRRTEIILTPNLDDLLKILDGGN